MSLLKTTNYRLKTREGFIAFSTVIIVAAIALVIAVAVTYLSISEAQSSYAVTKGDESLFLTEGCVEDALIRILVDNTGVSFTSTTITQPQGVCQAVVSKNVNVWTMTMTNSNQSMRKIQTVFTRNPPWIDVLRDLSDDSVGSLVNGCTTTAENSAIADKTYVGGTISGTGGTCDVGVSLSGTLWTMTIIGTDSTGAYAGTREVVFDRKPPQIIMTSWKEI